MSAEEQIMQAALIFGRQFRRGVIPRRGIPPVSVTMPGGVSPTDNQR